MSQPAAASDVQTLDQLQSLEERIVHIIRLLHQMRQARLEAESEIARLRSELAARESELVVLRRQLSEAHREREEVRRRVEKLLSQIDSIAAE